MRGSAALPADRPEDVPERAYRPGSTEDFDQLYRDSYSRLLYAMLGVLRDRAAAEDCVQETFVKAYASWSRWRPEAPAEAWLYRIALRVALSHRRRERLREAGETLRRLGRPAEVEETDPAVSVDLLAALRRLPPQQSFVIVLRHHHGYTNREIAAGLGLPESTIASRLAAARARLRSELGVVADDEAPKRAAGVDGRDL